VDVLRVQDPGALEWSFRQTQLPLQFIAENGNHNLEALKGWVEHVQGRMDRLVLSIELPKHQIVEYVRELNVPCELLGLGRILLFYTPRLLLSPLTEEQVAYNQTLSAVGESEESPHKGFPIVENRHGTFMFHIKDFCVLEFVQELAAYGLSVLRLDLRWSDFSLLRELASPTRMKELYPGELMRGFYHVNKTDVLFPKLKNSRLQNRSGDYIGEVLEAERGSHLAILVKNSRGLKRNDLLRFVHPKGDQIDASIFSLKNLALEEVESIAPQETALIQFVGGVWVKSHVFYR
jgi:putative protease